MDKESRNPWACPYVSLELLIREAIAAVSGERIANLYEGMCVKVGCKLLTIAITAVKPVSKESLNLDVRNVVASGDRVAKP